MEEDYCPIKTKDGKCEVGGECDHIQCWEKMHYHKFPSLFEEKMSKWARTRREDESRWKKGDLNGLC